MRILAIRGKNLASLANTFEVQLEQGPLKQVGLFAITGPTGSGKSTILDALCLALYDQMPRLPTGHSVAIGHKDEGEALRVKSNDVSSILRRGTAHAYAEVDFIGKDKQSYQARWEISRGRGQVTGRLQAQKLTLKNLNTLEIMGGGKRETLQAIEQHIGLNFDQFRRSVLLAQGDFAAFLKAKKDDRSNLLEKITGTDIYSELSIAAFERAKNEKQTLERITEKLADKTPLAAEERAELEQQRNALAKQLATVEADIKQKQAVVNWFTTEKTLKQEQTAAEQAVHQAQLSWGANEDDRTQLQKVEEVQSLRPLLQQTLDLTEELLAAESSIKQYQESWFELNKQAEQSENQLKLSEQVYLDALKKHDMAQPLLLQARQLDTQIESSVKLSGELDKNTQQQQAKWSDADKQLKQLQQQKTAKETVKQQSEIWLEQHQAIEQIANQWDRWEAEIKDYIAQNKSITALNLEQQVLEKTIDEDQQTLTKLLHKEQEIQQTKHQLTDKITDLDKQVEQHSLTDLHQQKTLLEQQSEQAAQALILAEKALELQANLYRYQQQLAELKQKIVQVDKRSVEIEIELKTRQTQVDEAQQAFNLIQAASQKTATDLRALLQPHEPCPVCGSEQHPWENNDLASAINLPIAAQQQRLNTLKSGKEQLIAEQSQKLTESRQFNKDQKQLLADIQQAQSLFDQGAEQWLLVAIESKPDWRSLHQTDVEQIKQTTANLKADYLVVKEQEQQVLQWQKQLNTLRLQSDQLNQQLTQQAENRAVLDKKLLKQSTNLIALEKESARLTKVRTELEILLSSPLQAIENWKNQLNQAGEAFVQKLQAEVLQWKQSAESLHTIESQLVEISNQLAIAEVEEKQQQSLLVKYVDELTEAKTKTQQLVDERQNYFAGKSANEFSEQLESDKQQAETKKRQLESNVSSIKTELSRCHGSVEHWQQEQQRRNAKKIAAEQRLDTALLKHHLLKQTLQELLSKDDDWIAVEKQKIKQLTVALQEAQASLKVKSKNLQAHQVYTPEEQEVVVVQQIAQLVDLQQQLSQQKENNSFALRSDDEKIALGKALHQQRMIQTQCWEKWESLNELIGSSNGLKFRVFAQSLTLENLLSYTNSHLQEFAQRYHLQRVPGSDLELQVVDRDMADEVRSVHSLSGGESFLVSLALALGLASLSSNKIQVESLFIDEGFGSLDQETLDIAIASLDTLQSLGRKVGVISHVPVLVERIGAKVVVEKLGGGQSSVSVRVY